MSDRFAVTGAHGCVGAWVVAELVREGTDVAALDVAPGRGRTELLLGEDELRRVEFRQVDIAEPFALDRITHVVHLAALQYPYCRDDHVAGARVNVVGTVNVFDAALASGAKLVYASSIAALARQPLRPWKRANEDMARAYWAEDGFPSTGIRAALVYGVGRDRGVTASMTLAMQAAARGESFHIVHGGSSPLNHAGDLARIFIRTARAGRRARPCTTRADPCTTCARSSRRSSRRHPVRESPSRTRRSPRRRRSSTAPRCRRRSGGVDWRPLEQGVRETVERFRAARG